MLLVFILLNRISSTMVRQLSLVAVGFGLIFFHLLAGIYNRFFASLMHPEIYKQWADLRMVSEDGLSLLEPRETLFAVLLPLVFLAVIVSRRKPAGISRFILLIVIVVSVTGWGIRLAAPLDRTAVEVAALPDFTHRLLQHHLRTRYSKTELQTCLSRIPEVLPRDTVNYIPVPGRGLEMTPKNSSQKSRDFNVIVVIMESVRAYECGFAGAVSSFTPEMDRLAAAGLVFPNFYANGSSTERAEFSILASALPNPAGTAVYILNPHLDVVTLPEILKNSGWSTHWLNGFSADFHQKRKFLKLHGIEQIHDPENLPTPRLKIGWGMSDEEIFEHAWSLMEELEQPFFLEIMTLSNHFGTDPYPTDSICTVTDPFQRYCRYARGTFYTDHTVAAFVEKILSSERADDTLLIVTGDHGMWIFPSGQIDLLRRREIYFRMPMIIWGPDGVIEPGIDQTLGSQIDLAPTILDLLNLRYPHTFMGRSLITSPGDRDTRFALMFLGESAALRQGDIFLIPETHAEVAAEGFVGEDKLKDYSYWHLARSADALIRSGRGEGFARITGDPLWGNFSTEPVSPEEALLLSKRMYELKALTSNLINFDAFHGLEEPR
jgi:phosphoglycerol transferase MdoB-like AlkP superfamily enzyme